MQKIEIASAVWYNNMISGTYPLLGKFKADPAASDKSDESLKRDGYVWIEAAFGSEGVTKKTRVAINECDFALVGDNVQSSEPVELTDDEIAAEISDRFEVMSILTQGVIDGTIKGVITAGAAGIGKTYNIKKMLKRALRDEKISKFSMMTGSCSAIGLFLQLYTHQNAGNVLVLDDIDSIFDDQEALNILKGALDTTGEREITWMKDSKFLENEGAERSFMFNGSVIFITNHNFDAMIAKGGKMACHYEALISRCMYLDLGIHSMKEVVIRIKQVVSKGDMMRNLGMSEDQTQMMIDWMMENLDTLRKVDLRTMIKLSQAIVAAPNGWKKIAHAALCRR